MSVDDGMDDNEELSTPMKTIPERFCWTRFGIEAGQTVNQIFWRKEHERMASGGVFLWGIGNAVGPSIRQLIRSCAEPKVVFSPIKSAPNRKDVEPTCVVAWTTAIGLDGRRYPMPEHSLVTSRFDPASPRKCHYALVCYTPGKLDTNASVGTLKLGCLRNVLTGRRVGHSQVTAVVQREVVADCDSPEYPVVLAVELMSPFFLRLEDPITLSRIGAEQQLDFETARDIVHGRASNCGSQIKLSFAD